MDSRGSGGHDRPGAPGARRSASRTGLFACLLTACAAVAIAGCGEGSGGSTSAGSATTPTSPATTSTAAKPPASKSSKTTGTSSTTPAKPATTPSQPGAKASTKASRLPKGGFGRIALTSSAFAAGGSIATRYTCDGAGVSPPLKWHGAPQGTAELFLLAIDLSGGASGAVQWAVAMPAGASEIPAGSLPAGAVAGVNSAGKTGWGGMCGAKGQLQHVAFLMYALRSRLGLRSGFDPSVARSALKGSTLALGYTLATHQR
ncbi:MAG TPA: YbhB/YbcL family Raf kinase inhibitor-like protein [Solirubrobacteraceae bacterium]|nr:YbhB/YbcL family Raf kinase inhibitor-like protein [Solirubrobacteraceae bacterium]